MQPLWKPLTEQLTCPTAITMNHICMFFGCFFYQFSDILILTFTPPYQTHLMSIS
jgi:hypothetical protein